MNRITRSPDFTLWIGVLAAMLFGAFLMRGTTGNNVTVALFFMLYFIVTILQIIGFTFGISKAALNQGSGSAAVRGFATVAKFAIPIYVVTAVLLVVDLMAGWRLAANPISLIMYFFSLRFLVARDANRQSATSLLRGANPTSAADGVAAQRRRQVVPDFSSAERPADVAVPAPTPMTPMPNLNKASARTPDYADAVRPADED